MRLNNAFSTVQGSLYRLITDERARRLKQLVVDLADPVFCKEREATCSQIDEQDVKMMNEDQRNVMQRIAETDDYLLVHGMPGTGKTTTIALLVSSFNYIS